MYLPPLCFPFFELRQGKPDRRSGMERRTHRSSVPVDRRHSGERRMAGERRHQALDRTRLLQEMRFPVSQETESQAMKYTRVFLTPAVIALGTAGITYFVNQQQIESADLLAHKQIESAEIIARSQLENSNRIADARLSTERLDQMIDMYAQIINQLAGTGAADEPAIAALNLRVASFQVYGEDALRFLIQLRDYQHRNDSVGNTDSQALYDTASEAARDTIQRIVSESQPNLTGQHYAGTADKALNLRHGRFSGFNMSGSRFENVNLFNADFTEATLTGSEFWRVDLVNADFAGANLREVVFEEVDVRGVNFRGASLRDAMFREVRNVGEAVFSLHVLLRANERPASLMSDEQLTKALVTFIQPLEEIHERRDARGKQLDPLYERLGLSGFNALRDLLETRKSRLAATDEHAQR